MTKREFEIVAGALSDDAYRQISAGKGDYLIHYRYCVTLAVALRKLNPRFNTRIWIKASIPEDWQYLTITAIAIKAVDAGSMRVWDEQISNLFADDGSHI